ncbi:MAG: T9SS type A sorting domain-containing protein [Bacteroidota bacterium]
MNNQHYFLKASAWLRNSSILASSFLCFSTPPSAVAENVISSGTTLKVMSGTSIVSVDNLIIKSGATLNNAGTIILKKNLTNENTTPNIIGTGTAEFSGTVNQTISGQNVIQNLKVNNAAGVTIGDNTTVNGILTLTNGTIALGSDNLLLGPLATIAGVPSASAMIIVTEAGQLRKEFQSGFTGSFTFPVGDDTGTSEYSPVTLTFTGGTFAAGNYVGVNLVNDKYPDANITGNYLKRYWTLTQSGITGFSCNATFQYLLSDVTGTESKLSCVRVNPAPWTTYALTNTASHILSATGITSFSAFTGLKSTTTPTNQVLANVDIPNGTTTCYDATQILTVAGNGTTFLVENNSNVTLVAGNKISMLYGTKVFSGGYLLGRITTTSIYCGSTANPLVENPEKELLSMDENQKSQWIKIYPNPTTDYIILELNQDSDSPATYVAIYNMNGKSILSQSMNRENKRQFSLSGQPVGIYMVHVRSNERSEIAKVVKN